MQRSVVVLRNAGHGVNDIFWFVLPSMLPVILEQFNMRYGTAGGLLTAFLAVIALFSFVLGKLSDHYPRYLIMGIGFLLTSSMLICASLMNSMSAFVVFLLIAGIGVGSFHPIVYASIDETTKRKKGAVYGMFELWGSLAIFLMFILHGLLLKQLTWQIIILVTSIPGLVMGSLYLSYTERFRLVTEQAAVDEEQGGGLQESSLPLFFLFLMVITFRFFGIMAVVNFTPTYLVRELGLETNVASFATGIYFLGGLVFTPILGRQCDVRSPFLILLLTTGFAFPMIFLLSLSHPLWILPLYLFLIGICYYGAGPAMNIIVTRMSGTLGKGEAFGYLMALIAITFSFSPLLFGMLADRVGLRLSMRIFSLPLLLSALALVALVLVMRRGARRSAPRQALREPRLSQDALN
jgi:MFS family permease